MILPANQFVPGAIVTGQVSGIDFSYSGAPNEHNERVAGTHVEYRSVMVEGGKLLRVPEEEKENISLATPEEESVCVKNSFHRDFRGEMEVGRTMEDISLIRQFTCQSNVKFTHLHSKLHQLLV